MSGRRGVVLVLVLIFIAVLVSAGAMVMVTFLGGPAVPTVPANATVRLTLDPPYSETPPNDVFAQFAPERPTLRGLIDTIGRAATDTRVKSLVITPKALGGLWAQTHELRSALVKFRESGKPLTAFLEYGGAQDYYLATAASRIVLMPAGQLDITGMATYELFFRGALDKLGVFPDLLHIGDYKTASNTFTEKGFTPAHREASQALNRDWFDAMVAAVAEGRKITLDEARQKLGAGPYLAAEAKAAGLVDELSYRDQLDGASPIQGTRPFDGLDYARAVGAGATWSSGPKVAVLYATGTIASGKSSVDGATLGSDTFSDWVRRMRIDPSVRAIVVRVDSPGGSAVASEVMWRELMLAREAKPVIVSMGDVAASGGYYIAVPGHAIVAEPGTITGSIGVVTGKYVLGGSLDKLGIGFDSVTDGGNAEFYSPFRPFSASERTKLEEQMRATYELFLSRVAEGRGRPVTEIHAVAQGRVWSGTQAKKLGLIDELGGMDVAIRLAKERAKIGADQPVNLVVFPPKRSIYEVIANPFGTALSAYATGAASRAALGPLASERELKLLERAATTLRLFRPGEPLAILPSIYWQPGQRN